MKKTVLNTASLSTLLWNNRSLFIQVDNPCAIVYNQIAFQKQSWKEVTMATKDAVLQALIT